MRAGITCAGVDRQNGDKFFFTYYLIDGFYSQTIIPHLIPPRYRGVCSLQMRGGERWPVRGRRRCGVQFPGPAVQAADLQRVDVAPGGSDGPWVWKLVRSRRAPVPALRQVVRAVKAMKRPAAWDLRGANLETPRAGRRGTGGLAADRFDKPRCREASRPVGPVDPTASRAPSVLVRGRRIADDERGRTRRRPKNTGGGALACLRLILRRAHERPSRRMKAAAAEASYCEARPRKSAVVGLRS